MELEKSNYTNILDSGYIRNDSLKTDYQGTIDMYNNGISFFNIEFDTRVILWWNRLLIENNKVPLDHTIYNLIGKSKDGSSFSRAVDKIEWFLFSGCKFNGDIYFNLKDNSRLLLESCIFEKEFNINKHPHPQQKIDKNITIEQLVIDNCIFKNNFLIQSCAIQEYRLIDVIYEENAKIFDVKFGEMFRATEAEDGAWFTNTIFNKSAIFEKVIFDEFIRFQYTTFKGYTLFRDIKFKNGLDFDYTNIEKVINFYNIQGLE